MIQEKVPFWKNPYIVLVLCTLMILILIPMATSIAFGELFATVVVLYLVPVTYSLYWSAGGRIVVQETESLTQQELAVSH